MLERRLTKKEFEEILSSSKIISELSKTRISFVYKKQCFKLDLFDNLSMLEVIELEGNKKIDIPKCITVIKEVTEDISYQNINLGKNINKEKIKRKI